MTNANDYQPRAEHKFSFGLWTVGNRGRDAFGDSVRPPISPNDIVSMLAEVGAWGVNLHDNDLVPIDATAAGTRPHRELVQESVQAEWHCCSDGHRFALLSPDFSRWSLHLQRSRSARLCPAENYAGHGSLARNWARRFLCCGADAKASRLTPAAAPTRQLSGCAKRSIISANTISIADMA